MTKDILQGLNDKQKEAVTTVSGPILIFAGPGSGKTRVLTHRIAYLISKEKIKPENILAVTFTNKAASEMKQRLLALLKSQSIFTYSKPQISTFHSLCVKILRSEIEAVGYKRNFAIADDDDTVSLVKKIMKEKEISTEKVNPRYILTAISGAKNELMDPAAYQKQSLGYYEKFVSTIYEIYQKALQTNNMLDFDDLIMLTVQIFQNNPKILVKYQEKYPYILVDEYQDTNHAQYALVKILAEKHKNIFVVGDDAQGIYGWRGANIRNILEFEKDYPEAKIICLDQNYRSTQTILDAAYSVISNNIERKDKKLWTEKKSGKPLASYEAENETEEAEFVIAEIKRLIEEGEQTDGSQKKLNFEDIAVLYRTNAQSRSLEEAFLRFGVPYKIIGNIKFYARREIKDILAYLRLIYNPQDSISLDRIINIPPRGLGKSVSRDITANFTRWQEESYKETLEEKMGTKKAEILRNFAKMITDLRTFSVDHTLVELMGKIIDDIDYEKYVEGTTKDSESKIENIKELLSVTSKFDKAPARESLNVFLEESALTSGDDEPDFDNNVVNLMTLHSAKGLEFDVVFITGLEEGILPHVKSTRSLSELEEERRLCYVGITRAREKVYLLFSHNRKFLGTTQANAPSRFLYEIPEHLIEKLNNQTE